MDIKLLITGLALVSALTTATTEAIKKLIDKDTKNATLIAAIVALVLSVAIGIGYILLNHLSFNTTNIITMIAFAFLAFLCATVGYDKIKEILEKFGVK